MDIRIRMEVPMPTSLASDRYERTRERLKAARLEAGLSQEQLAHQLSRRMDERKRQNYVSKVETGVCRLDAAEFAYYAAALGRRPEELLAPHRHRLPRRERLPPHMRSTG